MTTATSATTTGIRFSASQPPAVGEYLVIEPDTDNAELLTVRAVNDHGDGSYTATGLGNYLGNGVNFARAHPAGVVVRSSYVNDGVHPGTAMHVLMAQAVAAAKSRAMLSAQPLDP